MINGYVLCDGILIGIFKQILKAYVFYGLNLSLCICNVILQRFYD